MSISNTITHGITLGTAGTYASPLTITSSGYIANSLPGDAIYGPSTQPWVVVNAGRVASLGPLSRNGVNLGNGGFVANSGTIAGRVDGIYIARGTGIVNNSGTIRGVGTTSAGVALVAGGSVTNSANGLITAPKFGLYVKGGAGTLTNYGSITGGYGVNLASGGRVSNSASAAITGQDAGILAKAGLLALSNSGKISATATTGIGVILTGGGNIVNQAGASISGGSKGSAVLMTTTSGVITNLGTLTGYSGALLKAGGTIANTARITGTGKAAIGFNAAGTVNNAAGATIVGGQGGIYFLNAAGTITNSGSILETGTASYGIFLTVGGLVTNTASGSITATKTGIDVTGAAATIANYGTIAADFAVDLAAGGSITNGASAAITGLSVGILSGGRLSLSNSGTISTTAPSGDDVGVILSTGGYIVNQAGASISGSGSGVSILINGGSGTVKNFGSLSGLAGVLFKTDTTITNYARITGTGFAAIAFDAPGTVINGAGATLDSSYGGIYFLNGAGTIVNSGSIFETGVAGYGIFLFLGGLVTNTSSGSITARKTGIYVTGAAATLTNYGGISADYGAAFKAGGTVINAASGTIAGRNAGIICQGQPLTLSNSGAINANQAATISTGVNLWAGGTIVNYVGASLSGSKYGIYAKGSAVTLTNIGNIVGYRGVGAQAGGYVLNAPTGSITGYIQGVYFRGIPGTLLNSGDITTTATGGSGIYLAAGGTLTNSPGAMIRGGAVGVLIGGGSGTITNTGTIAGGAYAVHFADNAANLLVVNPGGAFVGAIAGGSGSDTLELNGAQFNPLAVIYNGLGLSNFETVLFGPSGYDTLLVNNTSGTLGVVISGFTLTSDTIDLAAIGAYGTISSYDTIANLVTVTGSLGSVTLQFDANPSLVTASDGNSGTNLVVACFCRGTRLLTDNGEVAVEALAIGQRVVTLSGELRPVKWIGCRSYDRRFVARNPAVLPIRIAAGALGDGVPARDLYVSPEHALYFDGILIAARLLLNGTTIMQADPVATVEYFHIELETHDILLAEGVPAESYVECDNRGMFHNAAEFARLYPDDRRPPGQFCAPRLENDAGRVLEIHAALSARAEAGRRRAQRRA